MRTNRKLIQRARWATSIALMLWCAGLGCALGTYAHTATRDHGLPQTQAEGIALTGPAAGAVHSCCKARHSAQHAPEHSRASVAAGLNEVALTKSSSYSDKMSCCPLTGGTFVVTVRQSVSDGQASEVIKSEAPALVLDNVHATRRALPLRLPNQSQTYLRGCAFLI